MPSASRARRVPRVMRGRRLRVFVQVAVVDKSGPEDTSYRVILVGPEAEETGNCFYAGWRLDVVEDSQVQMRTVQRSPFPGRR